MEKTPPTPGKTEKQNNSFFFWLFVVLNLVAAVLFTYKFLFG